MKRGIDVCPDYDASGDAILIITKQKGKLTLEDIRESAQEYDEDVYALIIDARQKDEQWYGEEPQGDSVTLYRAEQFFRKENEKANGQN